MPTKPLTDRSTEELTKTAKTIKAMIVVMILTSTILLTLAIVMMLHHKKFLPVLIVNFSTLPILLVNLNSLKALHKEIATRKA
ncbi:hypothetical protein SAMN05421788_109243 [Filimonas lacunae]|uniref:Redox-active disulfide protein 2 n=2 Tax=Filimonas lacunae TaxID=477680 RepID=A0A1N7R656_9BACT|nr:hypothetical protein SAMN05421788_109243 [Filimonas lacunae]